MAISDLLKLVPPPVRPLEVGAKKQWQKVQANLGIRLPSDLRDLATKYGTGYFEHPQRLQLQIWNPFHSNFRKIIERTCDSLRESRFLLGRRGIPYGIFPDSPGWFPFGEDSEGSLMCWVTEGEPDNWPILLIGKRGRTNFQQLRMPLTSFLTELFQGKLQIILWQDRGCPLYFCGPENVRFLSGTQSAKSPLFFDSIDEKSPPSQIEWLGPDKYGRPLGVHTVLGPWNVLHPGEEFTHYPDWWLTELPSPRKGWFRCHLLGPRLRGPGRNAWHNFVPVRFGAKRDMQGTENMVAFNISAYSDYKVDLVYRNRRRWPEKIVINAKNRLYYEIRNIDY